MPRAKTIRMRRDIPETWKDALQQFIWWKQAQGVSETTIEDYRGHVTRFFKNYPEAYDDQKLKKGRGESRKPGHRDIKKALVATR